MNVTGSEAAIDGTQTGVAAPRTERRAAPAQLLERVREQLTTTPGRLALVAIVIVTGAVCVGLVAEIAEQSRARAASSARTQTEPLLAEAVNLYASLSDANATATTTFLVGGLEPAARRARYLADVRTASDSLAALTRRLGGSAGAGEAVATVTRQLPVYTGLIEAARANNRQGLPVGAAYLRQASDLLKTSILPAAGRLYTTQAQRLRDDYDAGTSTLWLVAFIAAILIALIGLVCAQVYLMRVSHRILNVPILVATVLLAALGVWGVIGMVGEQNALARAQRNGSDSVEVLSAARILVSRAQSDESLTLVARGGDTADPADFATVVGALGAPGGTRGLVGEVHALAQRTGTTDRAREFDSALAAYLARHAQIDALVEAGKTTEADKLAAGLATSGRSPADRVSADLVDEITAAQARFARSAADATSALRGLSVAIPVVIVLIAALALFGLRMRQVEYR